MGSTGPDLRCFPANKGAVVQRRRVDRTKRGTCALFTEALRKGRPRAVVEANFSGLRQDARADPTKHAECLVCRAAQHGRGGGDGAPGSWPDEAL